MPYELDGQAPEIIARRIIKNNPLVRVMLRRDCLTVIRGEVNDKQPRLSRRQKEGLVLDIASIIERSTRAS